MSVFRGVDASMFEQDREREKECVRLFGVWLYIANYFAHLCLEQGHQYRVLLRGEIVNKLVFITTFNEFGRPIFVNLHQT